MVHFSWQWLRGIDSKLYDYFAGDPSLTINRKSSTATTNWLKYDAIHKQNKEEGEVPHKTQDNNQEDLLVRKKPSWHISKELNIEEDINCSKCIDEQFIWYTRINWELVEQFREEFIEKWIDATLLSSKKLSS